MLNVATNHENKFYYLVLINGSDFSFALLIKPVVKTVKNFRNIYEHVCKLRYSNLG